MTNSLAIGIGLCLFAFFGLDWFFNDWANTIFLGRKTLDMIEWLAFWR